LKFQKSGSNTQTDQFVSGSSVSETSSIATVASYQSSTYESTAKDEAIARLEKLIFNERAERKAREAARQAAMAKAAADKLAAEERAAADKKLVEEAIARERQKWETETSQKPLRERMSHAYKKVMGRNYDS
jgi:membrane protein involved in colicin uptake